MQGRQSLQQPTSVGSGQRCHVGHGADAEQVAGHLDRIHSPQPFGNAAGEHVGQPHTGKTSVGRCFRGGAWMQQCGHPWTRFRNGVVIGHDHVHRQRSGPLEGLHRRHSVVHGDQQSDALAMQAIDHRWIEAIALLHPGRDRRLRLGAEWLQGSQQKSCAGHAIGVVIAADRQSFSLFTGAADAFNRCFQIWEMSASVGQLRWCDQFSDIRFAQSPTKQQGSDGQW